MTDIVKIGLVTLNRDNRVLLVRKRGTRMYILPGGKPEAGENQPATLRREVQEELSCGVGSLIYHRMFTDAAANEPGKTVTVHVWEGQLQGQVVPANEIEDILWYGGEDELRPDIALSLLNQILPYVWREMVE